ncbi:hypothetical protein BG004_000320, partial [Podila humilis]
MSTATERAQQAGNVALTTAQDKTRSLYSKLTNNWLVTSYIRPVTNTLVGWYDRSPFLVKITLLALAALSAVPVACFLGFMSLVTAGCLVVGGIAFTIVEGGFATFASAFLIPTLGVTALMAFGVGLSVMVARVCYKMVLYGFGFFKSPDLKAAAEQRTRETVQGAAEKAQEAAYNVRGGL